MTSLPREPGGKRLLVLASTYPRWQGDPEPGFVHELAKRLVGDFEVTVLCPHAPGALTDESIDGVRVRRYRYAPESLETLVNDGGMVANLRRHPWKWLLVPAFLAAQCWSLQKALRQDLPDVIHVHWLLPQGLVMAALGLFMRLPPFLVTSHGADLFAFRGAVLRRIKRWVAQRASAVAVVSRPMQAELAVLGVDPRKVVVAPMGVDLASRFTPGPSAERSRTEILFVGRLVEKKGLRHLLDAMPTIIQAHPRATLTVAGFGPELPERQRQVLALGLQDHLTFLGGVSQDRLPALYRRAAVFVAPFVISGTGDQEGLGLVVAEAIGCGCPVVVSRLPQVAEAWGELDIAWAEPGDSASVARACSAVLASPAEQAVRTAANRHQLQRTHDWDVRSEDYRRLIIALMARAA